jgi:hypothetical protein
MREKENWMQIGAIINAGGKLGRIVKMQENTIDDIDYVYYITVILSGETEERRYHPNDIKEIKIFE